MDQQSKYKGLLEAGFRILTRKIIQSFFNF